MYRVNVSSVQDFYQCRFRWWCKWVMNRVPVATSPALDAGRLLHRAFERHFAGEPLQAALAGECYLFRTVIPNAHPSAQPGALEAVQQMEDLLEATPLWRDQFRVDEVLEVEQPFEWEDHMMPGVLWIGRPDRIIVSARRIWHVQNRGLASSMNFGTYIRLQQRSYHEHLYPEAVMTRYRKRGFKLGGTVFNLVRKLKFRTNVGKRNERVKTAVEMFFQQPMGVTLDSPRHQSVMMSLRYHAHEMLRVLEQWNDYGAIPAPNEKMNGGFSGNSEDPYFRVLIGEITLDDDQVFKAREDTYATGA